MTRKHVRDGLLEKVVRDGSTQKRYFFLFSDIMLYAKVAKIFPEPTYKGLKFSLRRFLTNVKVSDYPASYIYYLFS